MAAGETLGLGRRGGLDGRGPRAGSSNEGPSAVEYSRNRSPPGPVTVVRPTRRTSLPLGEVLGAVATGRLIPGVFEAASVRERLGVDDAMQSVVKGD